LLVKLALAQIDIVAGRPDLNFQTMLDAIDQAKQSRVDLIVFPEMAIPGYFLGDLWEQPAFLRDCEYFGERIKGASSGICIAFGNVAVDWTKKGNDGRARKYNAIFVAQNGEFCGGENFPYPFRIKTLQPNYREFDDSRHFFSAKKLAQEIGQSIESLLTPVAVSINNEQLSLGCILCEDGWDEDYSVKPTRIIHSNGGIDLVINSSSSPFTLGKDNKRNRVFSRQAKQLNAPVVYVNNVGIQNIGKTVYSFDGSSTVYGPNGSIIAQCTPFLETLHTIDLPLRSSSNFSPLEPNSDDSIPSIYSALHYTGKKFLDDIGIKKIVIGASGGIDSAVSAALYCQILGPENVLLVNMPSRYNSDTTKGLAASLAKNLGCLYAIATIQASTDLTLAQLQDSEVINIASGETIRISVPAIVAENIQARDRSARVLAAFASALGGGFTCNANKTEITVGYATLYGDLAGIMAILADLWKYQVYELGQYINQHIYDREVIPKDIFTIVPSAELSEHQNVDEGKGDPLHYPYHDYLFKAFMEWWEPASPEEILIWYRNNELETRLGCEAGLTKSLFADAKAFIEDLERWWKQFKGIAIAKRIQAPPVVAISRRAYGFDYREAQNSVYFTQEYERLKKEMLR